jgi:hypothetical protein
MRTREYIAPLLVLAIGSLQLIGYGLGVSAIRKLGQLSAASPLPLVFSHFRGLETFSPRFSIVAESDHGERREIPITPAVYSKLDGSYNRRNMYGAVFAFGAVLNHPAEYAMVNSVLSYSLCPNGPLRHLLEQERLVNTHEKLTIVIRPKHGASPTHLEVRCAS